jgi:hypothetical protein
VLCQKPDYINLRYLINNGKYYALTLMGLVLQLAKTDSQNIYPQLPESVIRIIMGCRSRATLAEAYLRN